MILNVRCCCQPTKVLGTLPVPEQAIRFGVYRVATMAPDGMTVHAIEVRVFNNGRYGQEHAVYSDDRPIDFWRQLPGFVESSVTHEHHSECT